MTLKYLILFGSLAFVIGCASGDTHCNQLDVAFLVDSSGSVNFDNSNNWNTLLTFVANVMRSSGFATFGPSGVQFATIKYSKGALVEFYFNTFNSRLDAIDHVLNMNFVGSTTNIAHALQLARTDVFVGNGERPGVPNVIILITDGKPNNRSNTISQGDLTKAAGITILTLGIGNNIDDMLMKNLSSNNQVLEIGSFTELDSIIATLINETCAFAAADCEVTYSRCSKTCGIGTRSLISDCPDGDPSPTEDTCCECPCPPKLPNTGIGGHAGGDRKLCRDYSPYKEALACPASTAALS